MVNKVSFSGAGWKLSFHLGVAKYLDDHHLVDRKRLLVSGSSAGAVVGASFLLGKDLQLGHELLLQMASEIKYKYVLFGGNWSELFVNRFSEYMGMEKDQNLYKQLNNRMFINITRFPLQSELISQYKSNEHFLETLIATQFIPTVCQIPARPGNGIFYYDGAVTDNFPDLGNDTLRVGFYLPWSKRKAHITSNICNASLKGLGFGSNMINTIRPNTEFMQALYLDGYRQAHRYFEKRRVEDEAMGKIESVLEEGAGNWADKNLFKV